MTLSQAIKIEDKTARLVSLAKQMQATNRANLNSSLPSFGRAIRNIIRISRIHAALSPIVDHMLDIAEYSDFDSHISILSSSACSDLNNVLKAIIDASSDLANALKNS